MSLTTDEIDAIRTELSEATYSAVYDTAQIDHLVQAAQIDHLVQAVEQLTALVEKLHARILFLEQQQQRAENY